MMDIWFTALGGIGLFLIGMQVLTQGLRGLAGGALRKALLRFTRSPPSGALTGAIATAILQSSSATTVATVGFVGAGLLTFHQALGVIFGANVGTTMTGWIVAIVGFKLHLTAMAAPLAMIGSLLKLFGRGWLENFGWALAGFSLIFLGIATLQSGMMGLESLLTPDVFPGDDLVGRLQLVLIGVAITVVTQSSSAGVAAALVALNVDALTFSQAACMVIGMDVGTTFSAALATLGGSTATRRTGYAHVIYNVLTGIMAFMLLSPYSAWVGQMLALNEPSDAQLALVAFHTSFNILGVMLVLGFTQRFSDLVIRLVPERGSPWVRRLDERMLGHPDVATNLLAASTQDLSIALFRLTHDLLEPRSTHANGQGAEGSLRTLGEAINTVSDYAGRIRAAPSTDANLRLQSALHVLDHLSRLHRRCGEAERVSELLDQSVLRNDVATLHDALLVLGDGACSQLEVDQLNEARKVLRNSREATRAHAIASAARGEADPDDVMAQLNGIRWLHRAAYHAWRIGYHLENALQNQPARQTPLDHKTNNANPFVTTEDSSGAASTTS